MGHYDFVFAGGGAAGLSLAYHLIQTPLRDRSILIIDRDAKARNDRTLSFWSSSPTAFDGIAFRSWDRLQVLGEHFEISAGLGAYRYHMLRSLDFYQFVRQALAAYPNVEFVQGTVTRIEENDQQAAVLVDEQTRYEGTWVFDSRCDPPEIRSKTARCRYFQQYFQGWEIEAETDVFDPQVPIFMDFRIQQQNDLHFCYVLPFSRRQALVEHVQTGRTPAAHGFLLRAYINTMLGIDRYRVVSSEGGANPLTDWSFPRRLGPHTMSIGTLGGRVKPSSGYAFTRIQRDSAAIVRSLLEAGHPFDVPSDPLFFRLCDSLMLRVLNQHPDWMSPLFLKLFERNPVERILSFLDETASPRQALELMSSLVPELFLQMVRRPRLPRLPEGLIQGKKP